MKKIIDRALVLMAVALSLTSCFEDEVQGTMLEIATYSQNVTEDPIIHSTSELVAYGFNVGKGEKWMVASWQDALDMKITNTNNPSEVKTNPDALGTCDPSAEYQLSLDLRAKYTSIVVVDLTNRVYAYRDYHTPINYPETTIQLHLYAWKKDGSANGWTFVNPFPDEDREALVPTEDEEIE
jgi:hypothetical protein